MKKKLLITMGCSYTEGVGCYDVDKMSKSVHYALLPREEEIIQRKNFHRLGWPNRLGKKLGYDKVINLGLGGSSTSGQVKQFFEKHVDKDLSEWDVLIVWLLSEPSRISFYKNGCIENFCPSDSNTMYVEYLKWINQTNYDSDVDLFLENIFHIKIIEQLCESKGYSLLLTPAYKSELFIKIQSLHKSKYYLNKTPKSLLHPLMNSGNYKCNIPKGDGHLTPDGYEIFASDIYNEIKLNHPHLVSTPKNKIIWQWDGALIDRYGKFPMILNQIHTDIFK